MLTEPVTFDLGVQLRSVDMFSHLNDHQLLDITDTCTIKLFHRGNHMVEAEKLVKSIFILLNGKIDHIFFL